MYMSLLTTQLCLITHFYFTFKTRLANLSSMHTKFYFPAFRYSQQLLDLTFLKKLFKH
jgi:hypothetical protein